MVVVDVAVTPGIAVAAVAVALVVTLGTAAVVVAVVAVVAVIVAVAAAAADIVAYSQTVVEVDKVDTETAGGGSQGMPLAELVVEGKGFAEAGAKELAEVEVEEIAEGGVEEPAEAGAAAVEVISAEILAAEAAVAAGKFAGVPQGWVVIALVERAVLVASMNELAD